MRCEALVIGGGLAGSAAATLLANAGRNVTLVEREREPHHKVCGEFLSAEALRYLATLGVSEQRLHKLGAVPIDAVRLAAKGAATETALPFAAMSLTRRTLDEELLRVAEQAGANVMRGADVRVLAHEDKALQAMLGDGRELCADAVFLATGKHDLRGLPRPAGKQAGLVAFKMYWRLAAQQAAELNRHVELLLYRGGYGGLQLVEDGVANLCCLIEKARYKQIGSRWENLLETMQTDCPHLRQRLLGATPLLEKPLAISSIPYGYVRSEAAPWWVLGDQAAVIPSFTGDGMSMALHSGVLAARMYLSGAQSQDFQQRLHRELGRQVGIATRLSRSLMQQPTRTLLTGVVRLWPGALRMVAAQTRIPKNAILA